MKQIINPESLVKPSGFNHGLLVTGNKPMIFISGQTASDEDGEIIPGDLVAQYEQILTNIKTILGEGGGSMTDIVKLNIFVRDKNNYRSKLKQLGLVHRRYFGDYYPTIALLEVSGLFQDDAEIEIEGIAIIEPG